MELVADAPGSKSSRSERIPRTTASSAASSSPATGAAAEASDAVERLSEQLQSWRAEEAVKEETAESRRTEATVPAPAGGCATRAYCVLVILLDGHGHAPAMTAVVAGGGDGGEVSLALPWKREPRASLLVTIAVVPRRR
jgi:hypothetical protein